MKRSVSALYSPYVIDGVQMDYTPAQMLDDCMPAGTRSTEQNPGTYDSIVDEITDPTPKKTVYDRESVTAYLDRIMEIKDNVPHNAAHYPKSYTRRKIAGELISALWKKGHFTLEDLKLDAGWKWDNVPLGNMAAFYFSAEAAGQYIFGLGIRLESYSFVKSSGSSDVEFRVNADVTKDEEAENEYDFFNEQEAGEPHYCWMADDAKCGNKLIGDPDSWLIYIPFDTCSFRLGDSLLERAAGVSGDKAPSVQDPDYFIDCFEVVRELIEDGVIISGTTVGPGGLAAAAASMCGDYGIKIDISGIGRAAGETDPVRILFSEIPGVLVQIRDDDYDYIDSQMLLQDIAYFPLGHPVPDSGFGILQGRHPGVSDILASLVLGHCSEGED